MFSSDLGMRIVAIIICIVISFGKISVSKRKLSPLPVCYLMDIEILPRDNMAEQQALSLISAGDIEGF